MTFPPACHLSPEWHWDRSHPQQSQPQICFCSAGLKINFANSLFSLIGNNFGWCLTDDFSSFNQTFVYSSLMSLKRCDEYLIEMINFLPSELCWVKRTELILRGVWNKRIATSHAMVKWWDNIKIFTVKTMGGKRCSTPMSKNNHNIIY